MEINKFHKLKYPLILASGSVFRLKLLNQILINPDLILAPNIDETKLKNESQRQYSTRVTYEKALEIQKKYPDYLILSADTIICSGTRTLGKPNDAEEAKKFLNLLSGRRHRCYTTICLLGPNQIKHIRQNLTFVKFKRLNEEEVNFYLSTNEWKNCAGGYTISGYAAGFIDFVSGSYSSVVGLPLYEVCQIFKQHIE
jgi:septum formation protein